MQYVVERDDQVRPFGPRVPVTSRAVTGARTVIEPQMQCFIDTMRELLQSGRTDVPGEAGAR